ncbi:MAG: hypothetical protein Fur005_15100 [Roseiflexaceae bacterium]
MGALFVALGIMVLALLALLLWFVPHLLQQQAMRVSQETAQLREMLLDLLNEQEAVAVRQSQLGTTLSSLQIQLTTLVDSGPGAPQQATQEQIDARIADLQQQIQAWIATHQQDDRVKLNQDNESWAYLLSLLAAIQERVGSISDDRTAESANTRAQALLEELEQEMAHLKAISEDVERIQSRLKRSLNEHSNGITNLRSHMGNSLRAG